MARTKHKPRVGYQDGGEVEYAPPIGAPMTGAPPAGPGLGTPYDPNATRGIENLGGIVDATLRMVNPAKFDAALQTFPASQNIEDRRGQTYSPPSLGSMYTQNMMDSARTIGNAIITAVAGYPKPAPGSLEAQAQAGLNDISRFAPLRNAFRHADDGNDYAAGGPVRRVGYADGGEVDDQDYAPDPNDPSQQAQQPDATGYLDQLRRQIVPTVQDAVNYTRRKLGIDQSPDQQQEAPPTDTGADRTPLYQQLARKYGPSAAPTQPSSGDTFSPADQGAYPAAEPGAPVQLTSEQRPKVPDDTGFLGLAARTAGKALGIGQGETPKEELDRRQSGTGGGLMSGLRNTMLEGPIKGLSDRMREYLNLEGGADSALPHDLMAQKLDRTLKENPQLDLSDQIYHTVQRDLKNNDVDGASKFIQGLRPAAEQMRAFGLAALNHSDLGPDEIQKGLKFIEMSHNYVPDGTKLNLFRYTDGTFGATVTPRTSDEEPKTYRLTPEQLYAFASGPASQFDHIIDNGTTKNLDILTAKGAAAPARTGYANAGAPTQTAPDQGTAPVGTYTGPQGEQRTGPNTLVAPPKPAQLQRAVPPLSKEELMEGGLIDSRTADRILNAGDPKDPFTQALSQHLPKGMLDDPAVRKDLQNVLRELQPDLNGISLGPLSDMRRGETAQILPNMSADSNFSTSRNNLVRVADKLINKANNRIDPQEPSTGLVSTTDQETGRVTYANTAVGRAAQAADQAADLARSGYTPYANAPVPAPAPVDAQRQALMAPVDRATQMQSRAFHDTMAPAGRQAAEAARQASRQSDLNRMEIDRRLHAGEPIGVPLGFTDSKPLPPRQDPTPASMAFAARELANRREQLPTALQAYAPPTVTSPTPIPPRGADVTQMERRYDPKTGAVTAEVPHTMRGETDSGALAQYNAQAAAATKQQAALDAYNASVRNMNFPGAGSTPAQQLKMQELQQKAQAAVMNAASKQEQQNFLNYREKIKQGQAPTPQEEETAVLLTHRINKQLSGADGGQAAPQQPVRVSSPEDARRLPSGTQFMLPDGEVRVRN